MLETLRGNRLFHPGLSWLLACALHLSCDERPRGKGGDAPASTVPRSEYKKPQVPHGEQNPSGGPAAEKDEPSSTPEPEPPSKPPSYDAVETTWRIGDVHDVGPAAPMSASSAGVYFVTKSDGMYLARRDGDHFVGIDAPSEAFFRYGRGPSLTKTYAYWVSVSGQLTRSPIAGGETEYLAPARPNARVTAFTHERDVALYLMDDDAHLRAMAWMEGFGSLRISADGSDVTSLTVLENGAFPRAVMLEGRSGMSPVHLRTLRLRKGGVELGPDEVIWVGPGSHPLTEIRALDRPGTQASAFIATARDMTHFGLALLDIAELGGPTQDARWRTYPNGLDPAPTAPLEACGGHLVFFVVPTEQRPRSPQELRVGWLEGSDLKREEVLVRSRAFNEISVASMSGNRSREGVILAWTADRRTWAMAAHCPTSPPGQKATK